MNRRSFLESMLVACVSPAIVRAETLMRIKPILLPGEDFDLGGEIPYPSLDELSAITRRAFVPQMVVQIYNNNNTMMQAVLRDPKSPGKLLKFSPSQFE